MNFIILVCIIAGIYSGLKSNKRGFWYGVGKGLTDTKKF